ncbi:MAG: sigma-70 family RNA polymerase sigma factor [Myxococcota bacterium]
MTLTPDRLRQATAGDPRARQAIVDAHGAWVFAMCRRLCPDPEDAYQEVWVRVFGALDRFDADAALRLRPWIGTIARRHLIDRHRRAQVRGLTEDPEALVDPGPAPDRLAHRAELRRQLDDALADLPFAQRAVIVMHDVHGVPLATLAEDHGVALGTIKSRLHRGRARLAGLLRSLGNPSENP